MKPVRRCLLFVCLFVSAVPAFAATRSWTGAVNNLWSAGGNWSGGIAPVDGDSLLFPDGAANAINVNDLSGLSLVAIDLPGTTTSYTLGGNAVSLSGGMSSMCCQQLTWALPATLTASQTFAAAGKTNFAGTVDLNGHALTIATRVTTVSGSIGGNGDVAFANNGVNLTGSIAITGNVTLNPGARLNVSGSISAASVNVGPGSNLSGQGTLPATAVNGGTLRLGNDPDPGCCGDADPSSYAILRTGNLSAPGGTLAFDLPDVPGHQDQLDVSGTVVLDNTTLQLNLPFLVPPAGTSFLIVNNDGADAVSGTFAGLPEGATFTATATTLQFRITYLGGTGNDVVVTILSGEKSWTGAVNNLWSVGGNWNRGIAPLSGDPLSFPADAANKNNVNDLIGLTAPELLFSGTTSYTVGGNAISLTDGIVSDCCQPLTFTLPISITRSQPFKLGGVTDFAGTIHPSGHTLTIDVFMAPGGVTTVSGSIDGSGDLAISQNGVHLTGSVAITGSVTVNPGARLNVSGTVSAESVDAGAGTILSGNGTLPATVVNGGTLRAGNDPGAGCCGDPGTTGILTTGNLSAPNSTLAFDLVTPVPGAGHDQLRVNGTVVLSNTTLQIAFPSLPPAAGTAFTIVDNDGADAVSGTFAGHPEGSTFFQGSTFLRITYAGGSGNDVVLTVIQSAQVPSGVPMLDARSLLLLTIAIAAIGARLAMKS